MPPGAPRATLAVHDVIALIVGVVVGAGIFRTPSLVASQTGSELVVLLAWLLGGAVSVVGALCYAELATTYPHAGGDYHYLRRSFGAPVGFLFAWARMTVVQTGSIALQAFLVGDYASRLLPLGQHSSSLYAGLAVAFLTALNLAGLAVGRRAQNLLSAVMVGGLLAVLVVGLAFGGSGQANHLGGSTPPTSQGAFGLAMIFVLLTYGGWNEAAYLSAEVRAGPRALLRALLGGLGIITALYVLANVVALRVLGLEGVARSGAVMADVARVAVGPTGAALVSALVVVCALGTMNATIITGARGGYALGRDFDRLRFLGRWRADTSTPPAALLVQGGFSLLLVLLGTATRDGFATMVEYTAPVFWLFFALVGGSLFVLRRKDPERQRPFRVPLYPLTPVLFCATAVYMLVASLRHTGIGAMVGVAVLFLGVPALWLARRAGRRPGPKDQPEGGEE